MRNLEVVHGRDGEWTDEQVAIVNDGIRRTNATVPPVSGTYDSFLVLDGDRPIGLFTLIPTSNPDAIEVGVRFWEKRAAIAFVMAEQLAELFELFPYVLARCYANNMNVRHLLQRAGFILLGVTKEHGRTLHTYGCRRVDFHRVAPLGRLYGAG